METRRRTSKKTTTRKQHNNNGEDTDREFDLTFKGNSYDLNCSGGEEEAEMINNNSNGIEDNTKDETDEWMNVTRRDYDLLLIDLDNARANKRQLVRCNESLKLTVKDLQSKLHEEEETLKDIQHQHRKKVKEMERAHLLPQIQPTLTITGDISINTNTIHQTILRVVDKVNEGTKIFTSIWFSLLQEGFFMNNLRSNNSNNYDKPSSPEPSSPNPKVNLMRRAILEQEDRRINNPPIPTRSGSGHINKPTPVVNDECEVTMIRFWIIRGIIKYEANRGLRLPIIYDRTDDRLYYNNFTATYRKELASRLRDIMDDNNNNNTTITTNDKKRKSSSNSNQPTDNYH